MAYTLHVFAGRLLATARWLPAALATALVLALLGCRADPELDTEVEPPPPETAGPGEVVDPVPYIPPATIRDEDAPAAPQNRGALGSDDPGLTESDAIEGDAAERERGQTGGEGDAATPGLDARIGARPPGDTDQPLVAGDADPPGFAAAATGGARARGRYLAERVAMCIVCHSPKDEDGLVILERKFQGAPMPVEGPLAGPDWALEVPAIAGMTFYTRGEAIRLLTEGIARDGNPPRLPMPRFEMTEEDAAAVYEYLASLPQKP